MPSTLWLAAGVFPQMCHLANEKYPLETGGVLLGYEANADEVVVRAIVGPGPRAQHFPHRFIPDTDYQEQAIVSHHLKTNGVETYLGDWHTHPDGTARLSSRDKKTLRNIAASPTSGITTPVMTIVTRTVNQWEPHAFRLRSWSRGILSYRRNIETLAMRV